MGALATIKTCISDLLLACHTQGQVSAHSDKDWPKPTVEPGVELVCVKAENGDPPPQSWEAAILGRNANLMGYF